MANNLPPLVGPGRAGYTGLANPQKPTARGRTWRRRVSAAIHCCFAAWTPPASQTIRARRGGPLEATGTGSRAIARSPSAEMAAGARDASVAARGDARGGPGGAAEDVQGWRAPGQGRARPGRGKRPGRVGQRSAAGSIRAARIAPQRPGSRDAASPQGPQADAGATGAPTAAAAACVMRRAGLRRSQPRVRRATRAGGSVGGGSRGACEARVLAERSVTGAAAEEACCYAAG